MDIVSDGMVLMMPAKTGASLNSDDMGEFAEDVAILELLYQRGNLCHSSSTHRLLPPQDVALGQS